MNHHIVMQPPCTPSQVLLYRFYTLTAAQRRRQELESKLQQLTLELAEEAGPRRTKRSRGEVIDKANFVAIHLDYLALYPLSFLANTYVASYRPLPLRGKVLGCTAAVVHSLTV